MEKLGESRWRVNGTTRIDDFRREYPELGEVLRSGHDGRLADEACLKSLLAPGQSAVFRGLHADCPSRG